MDNHAFFLIASGCGEDLTVPDCAGGEGGLLRLAAVHYARAYAAPH